MPKDTKSSGYNKAPACESRGFGHKKEGENFDTPSCLLFIICILIGITSLPQSQRDISISDLRTRVANITQTRK